MKTALLCAIAASLLSSPHAPAQRPRVLPPAPAPVHGKQRPPAPPPVASKPSPKDQSSPTDGTALITVLNAQNEAILHRLNHRLVKGEWKKQAMPSGAAGMNLYAAHDHEAKTYTRNPNLWAQDLVRHLTGVSLYNQFSRESYGGVLITPRHLLFCAHAHPHAHLTFGPNPNRPGAIHRFLTSDGRLVESLQLHQAKSLGSSLLPGLSSVDLCVAVMDRDLEAEGLKVVPVFPAISDADDTAVLKWAEKEKQPFAFIGIGQGTSRRTSSQPPKPIADYPKKHERMCYIKDRRDMSNSKEKPGPFAAWNYAVWDGDSGTATFLLLNGEPHLWSIITTTPGNGPRVGSHIDHINTLIAAADANAIALKRLEEPTGHKLRVGKLPQ